jgi:hypothetical protein
VGAGWNLEPMGVVASFDSEVEKVVGRGWKRFPNPRVLNFIPVCVIQTKSDPNYFTDFWDQSDQHEVYMNVIDTYLEDTLKDTMAPNVEKFRVCLRPIPMSLYLHPSTHLTT